MTLSIDPDAGHTTSQVMHDFEKYNEENPHVYRLFEQFAMQVVKAGRHHYGAWAIVARIRWHLDIEVRMTDDFKINNNFTAIYARMFRTAFPSVENIFELRRMTTGEPTKEWLYRQIRIAHR